MKIFRRVLYMKRYEFKVTEGFKNLIDRYSIKGISDLDIGEEAKEHNVSYKHLEAWDFNDDILEIFVED
jgi:hypothetical protein